MFEDIAEATANLLEAAEQVSKERRLKQPMAIIRKGMAKAFRKQGAIVLSGLKRYRDTFPTVEEALGPAEFDPVLSAAFEDTSTAMYETIEEGTSTAMAAGADSTIATTGVDLAFDLKNPRAVSWLESNAATQVTAINETTKLEMRRILAQATNEGWSYNKTAKIIRSEFEGFAFKKPQLHIRDRATLVAVTESGNAYEEGSRMAIDEMEAAGLRMEKHWLNVGDDRVSDGCVQNSAAGWIPSDAEFPSGDQHPPRFPGCRCSTQYRRTREMTQLDDKRQRALRSHMPATAQVQRQAEANELRLAQSIRGKQTRDNEPFDVVAGNNAIEVKTIVRGTNDKITMHPESRLRKVEYAKAKNLQPHTVVFDDRTGNIYYRQGVGSFRLGSMDRISLSDLGGRFI